MNRGLKIFILTITCLITALGVYQASAQEKTVQNGKVAVVNGTVITQEQFDREMIPVQELIVAKGKTLTDTEMATVKQSVLDKIIKNELLYQECQKSGVEVNDAEVNQKFDSTKGKFASDAEFQARLKELNTDETTFKFQLKRELAIQRLINQKFKPTVTDQDAKAYYDANPNNFKDIPFEQAKDSIIKQMGKERIADSYNKFYTEVKNKAKIDIAVKQ
jgi:hypothetical protein